MRVHRVHEEGNEFEKKGGVKLGWMGGVASERGPYARSTRLTGEVGTGKGVSIAMANAGDAKQEDGGKGPRATVVTTKKPGKTEGTLGETITERRGQYRKEEQMF